MASRWVPAPSGSSRRAMGAIGAQSLPLPPLSVEKIHPPTWLPPGACLTAVVSDSSATLARVFPPVSLATVVIEPETSMIASIRASALRTSHWRSAASRASPVMALSVVKARGLDALDRGPAGVVVAAEAGRRERLDGRGRGDGTQPCGGHLGECRREVRRGHPRVVHRQGAGPREERAEQSRTVLGVCRERLFADRERLAAGRRRLRRVLGASEQAPRSRSRQSARAG